MVGLQRRTFTTGLTAALLASLPGAALALAPPPWRGGIARERLRAFLAAAAASIPAGRRIAVFEIDADRLMSEPVRDILESAEVHGFKAYVVTGDDLDRARASIESRHGIPPERVIAAAPGRVVAEVYRVVAHRPVLAVAQGDRQLLDWTASGDGLRLAIGLETPIVDERNRLSVETGVDRAGNRI
ncbi:MAG TPA: hypothetical protein VGM83_16040 [Devosiaceae bacterium]|jgi:hypothetical protein